MDNDQRKKLFDLLCSNSSVEFADDLRTFERLPGHRHESFEVSCELSDGSRVDKMRLAVMCLYRQKVLDWLSSRPRNMLWDQNILFDNSAEDIFGIGFADYPPGEGVPRIKIYNDYDYGCRISQFRRKDHIQRLFSKYNVPDGDFKRDLKIFKRIHTSCFENGSGVQATIKVYYGPFPIETLFSGFVRSFLKEEVQSYDALYKKNVLPRVFYICVKYSKGQTSMRTDMCYRTSEFASYLRSLDPKKEALMFLKDFYHIFPQLRLEYIGMQLFPIQKFQFYFFLGDSLK